MRLKTSSSGALAVASCLGARCRTGEIRGEIMNHKKKAFTLTELLIVVIVIGILSAVVLPKFNKVVETRKTTEAEEVMAAIRTEQEKRCALHKMYTNDFAPFIENGDIQLASVPGDASKAESNNFTYALIGRRIKATSKDKGYTLQMPSIADGRISCDGNYCSKLNKDYPTSSELMAKADYMTSSEECSPTGACDDEDALAGQTESCECTGTRSRVCNNGAWTWGECVGGSEPAGESHQYTPEGMEPAGCATRQIQQECVHNQWEWPSILPDWDTSACHAICTDGSWRDVEGSCGCNGLGTPREICVNGHWQGGYCTRESPCECTADVTAQWTCNANGTQTRSCNTATGLWTNNYSECTYTCPGGTKAPTSCTNSEFTASVQNWSCDPTTGQWVEDGGCERAEGACRWSDAPNMYCWMCYNPPTQQLNPSLGDKDKGAYYSEGKLFSFYYTDMVLEVCAKGATKAAVLAQAGNLVGCFDWIKVGVRARCQQGIWTDQSESCYNLYPRNSNAEGVMYGSNSGGVELYCDSDI